MKDKDPVVSESCITLDSEPENNDTSIQSGEPENNETTIPLTEPEKNDTSHKAANNISIAEQVENDQDESSSSESLLEVKLNEFTKRSELSVLDIRSLVVKCSSCGRQINHMNDKEVKKHRRLGVITCKDCYEFYGSSEFSQDESGYNYCTWCGNGGKLIVCDFCPNGFCNACIRRNFGRAEISKTNKEGWKCYCCCRKRLKPKIKFCNLIMSKSHMFNKSNPKDKKPALPVVTFPEKWLQDAFDKSEKSSKSFQKKLNKLKIVGKRKAKSLKHIVAKLEQVIEQNRTDLKNVLELLSKEYIVYIDSKKNEQHSSENEVEILNDRESPSFEDEDKNESSSKENLNEKANEVGKPEKNNSHLKEQTINKSDNPNENGSDVKDKEISQKLKMEAKQLLLKSSSESEKEESPSKLLQKDSLINENSPSENNESAEKKSILKNTAKRSLLFSDASSDDSDQIKKEPESLLDFLPEVKEVDIKNDSKLKSNPCVSLASCDHLLPNGETSLKIACNGGNEDEEAKLDKLVNQLCKLPDTKKRSKHKEETDKVSKPKKIQKSAPKPTPKVAESSSSISLSSSEDERLTKAKSAQAAVKPTKARGLSSSSSDIVSDSDEEEKKKPKKAKAKPKDDSADEFQPRKKRKTDKLLRERIDSTDDEKEKTTKSKTKKASSKKKRILSSGEEHKSGAKSSTTTSDDSDEEDRKNSKKQSKKRRRIQTMGSSSEEKDADGTTPGKGRKNIKKIISEKKLADSTKEAQLEEKERRKRIQDRQRLYNKIEDISTDGKVIVTKKMVLEVDQESKEEIVEIHPDLVCKLKPHQVNGVKFMWECTIETVKDLDKPGSGCILAHCMGLGKTLQVIAFLHTCLTNHLVKKVIKKAMIICPYNTALNWATEFEHWLSDVEGDILVHQLATCKSNLERYDILKYWFDEGGVIIVSYDIFRRLSAEKVAKLKRSERNQLQKYILEPGPDVVVCDEGHVLKNEASAIFKATSKLQTKRRIVLTGTPLQNNLKEYHCMLTFVKPNLLGNSREFRNRFCNPIMNGQYDDSNEYDVKIMKKRIHILHKLLEGCVQRCDYSALTKFLPPKHEFVISVKLSEIQMKMYECYLEKITTAKTNPKCAGQTLFTDFNNLRCIWNHPYMCIKSHERAEYKKLFKDDSEEEFINDNSESSKTAESTSSESIDEIELDGEKDDAKKTYRTRSKVKDQEVEEEQEEEPVEEVKQWFHEFISEDDKYNVELSGKMVLLVEILKECEAIGDKIILFSQSLLALDIIEQILNFLSVQPLSEIDRSRDTTGQWIKGLDYFRMDGTTSVDFRKNYIDMFNDPRNLRSRLFLISTRAGSLGTNLIGANRVIIFDTSWNPSHDVQAIFRVYRFGQIKPVYIYRLLAQGTMEEKIYDRQVTKLSLSCRVVDEQQIDRHFSAASLAELYSFDRNSTSNRPTPLVPKDRLLAEMLIKNKEWIVTYHEHDSLLQNENEEDLTEEERQSAWTEYENEREGKTAGLPSAEEELKNFSREPDFVNMKDYDGNMIPDLKVIISKLYEQLKVEMPNVQSFEFKQKLLFSVHRVRQALQEKHVKTLRMKQDCVGQGLPVPNALNKYLDELANALKSTGEYITKLQAVINQENAAKFKEQCDAMRNAQARMPRMNPQMGQRFVFRGQMPPSFINFRPGMQRPFYIINRPPQMRPAYASNQSSSIPTITEVDDNAPPEPDTNQNVTNTTSTVVIQEIT